MLLVTKKILSNTAQEKNILKSTPKKGDNRQDNYPKKVLKEEWKLENIVHFIGLSINS